jgi:GTP-binding protein
MTFNAEFLCSAHSIGECPRWERAEIALAGRSNVGKSSLLNALAERRNLARISKTPGRTRSLNFFIVGQRVALVDLPGYGYAQVSRSEAQDISRLLEQYLRQRSQLMALVLLVDARRGPQKEEFAIAELVRGQSLRAKEHQPRLIVAATKCDKLKRAHRGAALQRLQAIAPAPLICSSISGEGIDQLRREIQRLADTSHSDAHDPAGQNSASS